MPVKRFAPLAESKSSAFHDARTRLGGPEINDNDASVFFSNRAPLAVPLVFLSPRRVEPAHSRCASPLAEAEDR